jgi:hypothetical protein
MSSADTPYEDADDLDRLRFDPALKLACGRLPDNIERAARIALFASSARQQTSPDRLYHQRCSVLHSTGIKPKLETAWRV